MVGVILLQQGKGAGLGASFGGGARGGLYETASKANFLTRATSVLATIFLAASLTLSIYIGRQGGVLENLQQPASESSLPIESENPPAPEVPE